jgi:HD superfamily phosphohydrolase
VNTREFKDPIHGYIEFPESLVDEVIDTAPFQRLRHVRQLAATYLVYPGATHTRFEHSLGVYHLGRTVFRSLREEPYFTEGIDEQQLDEIGRTLQCACLLHDVGHPPLSHLSEHLLDVEALRQRVEDLGLTRRMRSTSIPERDGLPRPIATAAPHELLGCVLILDRYADPLTAFGVDPHEVCAYVLGHSLAFENGSPWQHAAAAELLHSPIDVDRLDYIIRDDHMTGADVLNVDTDRMVAAYTAHPDAGLALSEKALSTIGNYLEGRISLYVWVTQHHKAVYANVLLQRLLDELVARTDDDVLTVDAVLGGMDDYALLERFREYAPSGYGSSREPPSDAFERLYERFRTRDFAESCWKHRLGYADVVAANSPDGVEAYTGWLLANDDDLESYLAETLSVPRYDVWIERSYVPEYEPEELQEIPLAHNGRVQSLADYGLYGDRRFEAPIPFVYVPPGHVDDAIDALNERYRART